MFHQLVAGVYVIPFKALLRAITGTTILTTIYRWLSIQTSISFGDVLIYFPYMFHFREGSIVINDQLLHGRSQIDQFGVLSSVRSRWSTDRRGPPVPRSEWCSRWFPYSGGIATAGPWLKGEHEVFISGWLYTYQSKQYILVSVGMMIHNIWKNKT